MQNGGIQHIIVCCETDQPVDWVISDMANLETVWNVMATHKMSNCHSIYINDR